MIYNQLYNDILQLIFGGTFPNAYAEQFTVYTATAVSLLCAWLPIIFIVAVIFLIVRAWR